MMTVAIDGPAGAGKSTIARAVARAIGARFLDTGALYRTVALACMESGVSPSDVAAVEEIARTIDVHLVGDQVLLGGRDVSERIRARDVSEVVSTVSGYAGVRAALLDRQRALATEGDLVAEGRDMGTVVFPEARVKVFLDAAIEERARRRTEDLGLSGADLGSVMEELERRDAADSTRAASPLVKAPDAVSIDTTEMSIDEVVQAIVDLVEARS